MIQKNEEHEVSDVESDENADNSEDSESYTSMSKRKLTKINTKQHKKVKYEAIGGNTTSKKQINTKPPTAEELNSLKECETLYNSNLFRLQLTELLTQVKIKEKYKTKLTEWLKLFQETLDKLPTYENIQLSQFETAPDIKFKKFATRIKSNLTTIIKCDQDVHLNFLKPESLKTFGLFEMNALPGPQIRLNINLEMPRSCFNVKDYLNNRYFIKRYYYLLYIADNLMQSQICSKININYQNSSPIISITPKNCDKICVQIFITPIEGYFSPQRFLPDKNNVKDTTLFECTTKVENSLLKSTPTIIYNSLMCHDVVLSENNIFFENTLKDFEHVQESLKLLSIWLNQRALPNCFNDTVITYIITYLLTKRKLNKFMSSYQVVRTFWNFIITSDLPNNPISVCESVTSEVLNKFKESFDIVVLDKTGCYNCTAFLDLETFLKVKTEAEISLMLLDKGRINSFHYLFIQKLPVVLQYDLILDVKSSNCFKNVCSLIDDINKSKYAGNYEFLITNYITKVIRKALNKRASLIVPYSMNEHSIIYGENKNYAFERIMYGINLNPDNAFNIIELGPPLNDPEEQEFKNFWTHLTSNRRFRDGTARIAVYFETKSIRDRRDIITSILNYVINEKLEVKFKLHYNNLDNVIENKKVITPYDSGTNEETCFKVVTKSDELGKILRELDLSLSITSVQGASDVYSYSDIFPPIPTNYKGGGKTGTKESDTHILLNDKKSNFIPIYVKPTECVLQLEHSSKWPKNLQAIRHMKTAFYLEISKLLQKNHSIISSVTPEYIDVFYEGLIYRYRIYISREIAILKKEINSNGVISYKDSSESIELDKKLNVLPKVISALKGLQSQYPSFGPSTAMIKRWLSSQLIDDYLFPDVAVNLINASLYLGDSPFLMSMTPQIGFFRFLKFFSETQWDIQTIIVNFTNDISKEKIDEVESNLQKNRQAYPNLVILMLYDNCESIFTKVAPTKEILFRVKQLSIGSLKFYEGVVMEQNLFSMKELFIANYMGYNVIIRLKPLVNPRRHEEICLVEPESKIVFEAFNPKESTKKMPIINFDPVQIYLRELRENFGEFATFFHDTYGGNSIAVLWKPKQLENKDFKVTHVNGRKFLDEKLVLNVDALIEDFYIMGKNVVKLIEKQ